MLNRLFKLAGAMALCVPLVSQAAIFSSDFNSGPPPGSSLTGIATVDTAGGLGNSGVLKLSTPGGAGAFFVNNFTDGNSITNFRITYRFALGGGTCCGVRMADGLAFAFGNDLPAGGWSEDGGGTGIIVGFDTWDNAAPDTAPAIDLKIGGNGDGNVVAFQAFTTLGGALREGGRPADGPILTNAAGLEVNIFTVDPAPAVPTDATYVDVYMELFSDNTFSVSYSNLVIFDHQPIAYTPIANASFGWSARIGGANEQAWIDNLAIFANFAAGPATITGQPTNQTVTESQPASFSIQLDGTPPYSIQWYSNGVAIAGANGSTYTTPPTTISMSGTLYRAEVTNTLSGGVPAVSSNALLTVNAGVFAQSATSGGATNQVRVRFSKDVSLSGIYSLNNGATVNSVSYGATHRDVVLATSLLITETDYALTITGETGEDASSLIPDPSILTFHQGFGAICTDFATLPAGTALFSNGITGSGVLADDGSGTNLVVHLTDDGNNGAYGKLFISNRTGGAVLKELQARWRTRIGGDLGGHADGMSFNWANNLVANGDFIATDEGEGTGVSFTIDTWDGGSGPDTGIEIKWQASRIAFLHIPRTFEGNENFICKDVFVDTSASVNSAGLATFTYNGNTISATIPGWAGIVNGAFDFAARTGGENDNMWIDDVCINNFTLGSVFFTLEPVETTALEGLTATFTAAVDGSPPYSFQWYTNGVAIPGATSSSYTTPPVTAAYEGRLYSVVASNEFSFVTSSNAVLHVKLSPRVLSVFSRKSADVHILYTRAVDLNSGAYEFDNGVFEGTRQYGSSRNEVIITTDTPLILNTTYTLTITDVADELNGLNLILPNPTVATFRHGFGQFCTDFAVDQSANTTVGAVSLYGSAYASGGILHLTDNVGGQAGTMIIEDQNGGLPLDRLQVRYRAYVGGGGGNPADGYSFNFGNFANAAIGGGEEGAGTGLTVAFDNFDNGGGEAPAIDIKWNNVVLAHTLTRVMRSDTLGAPPVSPNFLNTYINLDPDGTLDVIVNGVLVYDNLATPFNGLTGARVGFSGRTGGLVEANWIDDLCINGFSLGGVIITQQPADATVTENPPQAASFVVSVDGLPPYSVQWYSNGVPLAGAAALAYNTPPLNRTADGAGYFAVISNFCGSVTSRTAVVTVIRDTTPPSALSAVSDCSSNVYVLFNETLGAASANNPANYTIDNGVTVTGAALDGTGRRVVLTVSPPINPNDCDILTITGVTDRNAFPNTMADFRIAIAAKAPLQSSGPDNLVVIEAEDFDVNRSPSLSSPGTAWVVANTLPDFQGTGYVDLTPNIGEFGGNTPDVFTNFNRLDYCINFPAAGTYYLWARGSTANDGGNNSFHFGLDGVSPDEFTRRVGNRISNWGGDAGNVNAFGWIRDVNGIDASSVARIAVATPGVHTLNIWEREDGLKLDRFLLTTDAALTLTTSETGPTASARPATRSLSIVRAPDGNVTISWPGLGWTLQSTDQLGLLPAGTVWQTLTNASPLVIPSGSLGTGNTNAFFRLICP